MKTLLIGILALCISIISHAQRDTLPDPEAFFSAIIVKNIDTSIVWYADILGFKVLNQNANSERGFKQANLKRGDVLIELIELKTSLYPADILSNQPRGTQIGGFFKFGFLVAEFDKWINFLSDTKVEFLGTVVTDSISGKKMIIIKDPDGNRIQIFEK